jgi:hypothetical protein
MKFPFKKKKNGDAEASSESMLFTVFGKIGDLFNPEPQKEKVLRHEDFNAVGDTYYASVSVRYKILERILIIVLAVFLTVSLISNFSLITYDNFFYLIKDFSTAVDIESSNYDTLSYNSNQRHNFSIYREGLVVVNPSNISAYTATGRRTLQTTSQFSSPCVVSSDKYFLIYDTSGNTFSIYNSFSRVFSQTFEYPVTDACFSSDGKVAVVTRDISNRSLVHVYDEDFKPILTVPSGWFAFDIAMSSEANKMAICYYDAGDGTGRSSVSIRDISNNANELELITIEGEFILQSGFLANERFAVVTDKAVHIYDPQFYEYELYEYSGAQISGFTVNEHGAAVSYTENSRNYALVFDSAGQIVYNDLIDTAVNDIGINGQYVFLRTDVGVMRMDTKTQSLASLPSGQGKMMVYDENTVLVCGESKAEYLVFGD